MSAFKIEQYAKQYKEEAQIGKGSFGQVFRVRNIKDGGLFAFKRIVIHRQEHILDNVIMEIIGHLTMVHPLVVRVEIDVTQLYKFYCHSRHFDILKSGTEFGLIMELGLMSLERFIEERSRLGAQPLPLALLQNFAYSFIGLFAEMELQNKTHRDIKPANFIVFDKASLRCKLTDFGFCKVFEQRQAMGQPAGSYHYMSPKLKDKCQHPNKKISSDPVKDDVYSFGVTLYELASIRRPEFDRLDFKRLKDTYPDALLVSLIEQMMDQNEIKRPTFTQLRELTNKLNEKQHTEPVQVVEAVRQELEESIIKLAQEVPEMEPKPLTIEPAETGLPIHSVCMYKDMIFVGTEHGEVKVLHEKKIYQLPQSHTRSVQVLQVIGDEVWSAGCDCRLFIWDCKLIKEEINKNVPTTVMSQCSIFHDERTKDKNLITNESVKKEKKGFPLHREGISSVLTSGQLLVIGYYKGQLFVSNDDLEEEVHAHDGMVSCIRQHDRMLFTSGADGMLKAFDLQTMRMQSRFFITNSPIIGFQFFPTEISVVAMSGLVEVVTYNFDRVCPGKKVSPHEIFSYSFSEHRNLILNKQGELYDKQRRIARVECSGPNCVKQLGPLILITSFSGRIFHLYP